MSVFAFFYCTRSGNSLNVVEGTKKIIINLTSITVPHLFFFFWLIGKQKQFKVRNHERCPNPNTYLQVHLSQFIICIFDQDEAKQAVHKQYDINLVV